MSKLSLRAAQRSTSGNASMRKQGCTRLALRSEVARYSRMDDLLIGCVRVTPLLEPAG